MSTTPCLLTSNYNYLDECENALAGAKRAFVTEHINVVNATITAASTHIITAFTMPSGKVFREYNLEQEMCSFGNPATKSVEAGTVTYAPVVSFTIKKLSISLIDEFDKMLKNKLSIIIEDANGVFWLFGKKYPMDLVTVGAESGTKLADFNGHKLEFKGTSGEYIYQVTASLIPALLGGSPSV
jgi:hypothetical protein